MGSQTEEEFWSRIQAGDLIELGEAMPPAYAQAVIDTMRIAAEQEVLTLPWLYPLFRTCPDIGAKIAVAATIQDELGHAHQWLTVLEALGVEEPEVVWDTPPDRYHAPYMIQFAPADYIEFVVGQVLGDGAGIFWTRDFELHSSFAPMRRVARKVNYEEAFHISHGRKWVRYYWTANAETRRRVAEAWQWLFPHGALWHGAPDQLKKRPQQLTYRIRGWSNDQMRQMWFKQTVTFAERLGLDPGARWDPAAGRYVPTFPFPMLCDPERRQWSYTAAEWADVFAQWRAGTDEKRTMIALLQQERWGDALWEAER